jgi:hypothetical protein
MPGAAGAPAGAAEAATLPLPGVVPAFPGATADFHRSPAPQRGQYNMNGSMGYSQLGQFMVHLGINAAGRVYHNPISSRTPRIPFSLRHIVNFSHGRR